MRAEQELSTANDEKPEKDKLDQDLTAARAVQDSLKRKLAEVRKSNSKGLKEKQKMEDMIRESFTKGEGLEKQVNRSKAKANKMAQLQERFQSVKHLKQEHVRLWLECIHVYTIDLSFSTAV